MKKTNKFFSILLALIMVITIIPMSVFTTRAETISGTCGDNLTWTFDDETGTLTISGTGEMRNLNYYYGTFAACRESIKEIVIEDGVTTIGSEAFSHCYYLTSVIIPDSVISIGDQSFNSCFYLTDITIPDSVTSIGYSAFNGCSALKSITVPDTVTSLGSRAFSGCSGLTRVKLSDSLTKIDSGMFSDCTSLTNITIPDSVTTIGDYAFSNCKKLINITIPESATSIGYSAFDGCVSLTSISIPKNVSTIGLYPFDYCKSLTSITVDAENKYYTNDEYGVLFNKDKTELIQYPIGNTRTSYTIPNSVTTTSSSAFAYCDNLINLYVSDGVKSIGGRAFFHCKSLTSIVLPDSITLIGNDAFYDTAYYNDTTNWESDVLYICNHLIKANTSISGDYKIKDGTITIADYAFKDCVSLTNVTAPDDVTSIGALAFKGCTSLTSITIPNGIKSIGNETFYNCTSLTTVTIPDGAISIGESSFFNCTSLISLTIPDSVTAICDLAFCNCTGLTSVKIPNSVTSISRSAFNGCTSLTTVIIPDSVTSVVLAAFYDCNSLTDVYYCGTEEQWSAIEIGYSNESLLNAALHYHNYVDGTCTICGENKMILETMTSQIRFNTTAEKAYTGTFDVRTRVMISDEDFKELVGETNAEAVENIDKIGFVYTINGEDFSAESAKEVAQGGTVAGYVDAPVKNIQDAEGYYMFTCLVTDIPETDNNYVLTAYAYICVNGKWYVSEAPMDADFEVLYDTYYPVAAEKYGWEA